MGTRARAQMSGEPSHAAMPAATTCKQCRGLRLSAGVGSGLDGELFGWGARNYPRLRARMKQIGAIIAANAADARLE